MKLSCTHTHTIFCDGEDDVETMCRQAHEKGMVSIGFSSHAPIGRKTGIKTGWHMKDENLDCYIETVGAAKKRWLGKLDVYLGLEVDYIEGLCGPADGDIQSLPLDYIIGSAHYVVSPKNGELFTVDCPAGEFKTCLKDFFAGDGAALCDCYFNACCAMLKAGGFDIAGHLDLVKKNNAALGFFSPGAPAYLERLFEAADLAAAFVVEVNTGGMIRGSVTEPYPSPAALKRLRERGARLTVNADAHSAGHLGGRYDDAVRAMIGAGFAETFLFAGKRDGNPLWTAEKLK